MSIFREATSLVAELRKEQKREEQTSDDDFSDEVDSHNLLDSLQPLQTQLDAMVNADDDTPVSASSYRTHFHRLPTEHTELPPWPFLLMMLAGAILAMLSYSNIATTLFLGAVTTLYFAHRATPETRTALKMNMQHLEAHRHEFDDYDALQSVCEKLLRVVRTLPPGNDSAFGNAVERGDFDGCLDDGTEYGVSFADCQKRGGRRLVLQFTRSFGKCGALHNVPFDLVQLTRREGRTTLSTTLKAAPSGTTEEAIYTDLLMVILRDEPCCASEDGARSICVETAYCVDQTGIHSQFKTAPEPHVVLTGLCNGTGYQFLWKEPAAQRIDFICNSIETWLCVQPDGTVRKALVT